jgi:DNA-binding transcriptional ArsR family regulator
MDVMSDELTHPDRAEIRIEAVLHALADPVRLHYVREMDRIGTGVACGSIELPVTKSTRTHHLRTLREAGVIWVRKEGTARIATIRRDDLDARFPGLLAAILSAEN